MMNCKNAPIQMALFRNNMTNWQLADLIGVADGTLCRYLRHEVPENVQKMIIDLIETKDKDKSPAVLFALRNAVLKAPKKKLAGKATRGYYDPLARQMESLDEQSFSKFYLET